MKIEKLDFMTFLVLFLVVTITSFVLALNSSNPYVFVGFYAFTIGAFVLCSAVYLYPVLRDAINPEHKITIDPGDVLLKGVNGERPGAKSRNLEDMIRRTEI